MDEDLISKKGAVGALWDLLWRAVPLEADGPDPGELVPAPFDAERTGDVFSHEADLPRAWSGSWKARSVCRSKNSPRSWRAEAGVCCARDTVLETKYGSKPIPSTSFCTYLTEGEHKTDILEHLKEEAL